MPRHGLRTDSSTDEGDTELVMHTELVMRMIEVMSDGRVLQELKSNYTRQHYTINWTL